ncbi:hypothetical protein [Kribbella solani]|uniref:Uncharacterized protein n=1 Tax=Kribbella solani TaxID=236067 RepID=A0A841DLC7_9ACTN|nr:hypothetical protein [Kribbella solani]MBB5979904.1 hypothetical protein [Kribbella solani]
MGVDVVLKQVSRPGTSSKRRRLTQLDIVPDTDDVFARICERSKLPMLSRVDPYGDLILTAAEMPQLLEEVETERKLTTDDQERVLLAAVHHLGERCSTEPYTELHLQGD